MARGFGASGWASRQEHDRNMSGRRTKPRCPECDGAGGINLPVVGDTVCPLCDGAGTWDPADIDQVTAALRRSWGANVRRTRLAMNMDQATLAERCGVTQQLLSAFERGMAGHRDTTRLALAQALGVSPRILFPWAIGKTRVMEGQR